LLPISSESPAKSLSKASCLALSKLISLPVKSWNDNSFSIEDSKSSKEPAIASTPAKLIPNPLASVAASANNSGDIPNDTTIDADAVAISFNTALALIADLFCLLIALTVPTVFSKTVSVSAPCVRASNANCEASFVPNPNCLVRVVIVTKVSPPKSDNIPVVSAKAEKDSFKALEVIKSFPEVAAVKANSF